MIDHIDTLIIGAGHAGLAMSRCLTERSIDHVLLERGEVANSWRKERWDSLRLLTPNWQSRLPGQAYEGSDPDGFMTMPEVIDFVSGYAQAIDAPVQSQTTVKSVQRSDDGYQVVTDRGIWHARTLVLASGANNVASVPRMREAVPRSIVNVTPLDYKRPDQLPEGGVMVVGASATGAQLADEIHRSGRPVTLVVGEHVRMPRVYRGRDILWWMDRTGLWDERYDQIDDVVRGRNLPSPQLVGTPERKTLDLNTLSDAGVQIVGRLAGIRDGQAQFSGALRNVCAMADLKMGRLLDTFDEWADEWADRGAQTRPDAELDGIESVAGARDDLEPTRVPDTPRLGLDLESGEIRTIVWATGFRPDYSWLDVPVLDRKGHLRHEGGVVDAPGMVVLGLPLLRRRKSSFIHGAEDDARELSEHLAETLDRMSTGPTGQRPGRSVGGWESAKAREVA